MLPTINAGYAEILLLIFFVCLFFAALYSSFLIYHWYAYGADRSISRATSIIYLVGVMLAFAGMGASILMIT